MESIVVDPVGSLRVVVHPGGMLCTVNVYVLVLRPVFWIDRVISWNVGELMAVFRCWGYNSPPYSGEWCMVNIRLVAAACHG